MRHVESRKEAERRWGKKHANEKNSGQNIQPPPSCEEERENLPIWQAWKEIQAEGGRNPLGGYIKDFQRFKELVFSEWRDMCDAQEYAESSGCNMITAEEGTGPGFPLLASVEGGDDMVGGDELGGSFEIPDVRPLLPMGTQTLELPPPPQVGGRVTELFAYPGAGVGGD